MNGHPRGTDTSRDTRPGVLVSACLAGEPVRYDGRDQQLSGPDWDRLLRACRVLPVCPEVSGGLTVPRPPAEIAGGTGDDVLDGAAVVATRDGSDVTPAFVEGARQILRRAEASGVRAALLAERSPSCGSTFIYDGRFTGNRIPGAGVTTAMLRRRGIRVFSQNQLHALLRYLTG